MHSFRPPKALLESATLNNAQIAQLMVRPEVLSVDRSAVYSVLKTLSEVRNLRRAIIEAMSVSDAEADVTVLDLVREHIGLNDQDLVDVEFE